MDSNKNDPLRDLTDAVDRDVETWDPDVEPKIAGQVVELGDVTTTYGTSPTVNILTPDGREVRVSGFGAVLQRALSSGIEPGDLLAIRYLGKTQPRSGQQAYKDFRVIVRRADGSAKGRRVASNAADVPDELTDPPAGDLEALLPEGP
jgi:hypothetical protein